MKYPAWVIARVLEFLSILSIAALFVVFLLAYATWNLKLYHKTEDNEFGWDDIRRYLVDLRDKLKGTYVEPSDPDEPELSDELKQLIRKQVEHEAEQEEEDTEANTPCIICGDKKTPLHVSGRCGHCGPGPTDN